MIDEHLVDDQVFLAYGAPEHQVLFHIYLARWSLANDTSYYIGNINHNILSVLVVLQYFMRILDHCLLFVYKFNII